MIDMRRRVIGGGSVQLYLPVTMTLAWLCTSRVFHFTHTQHAFVIFGLVVYWIIALVAVFTQKPIDIDVDKLPRKNK